MKYDPKTEALVFAVVKDEGEATRERLLEVLEKQGVELSETELVRYLFRWKARKVVTPLTREGEEVWKVQEIPPWFASGMMDVIKKTTNEEMKVELKVLAERLKSEGMTPTQKTSQWSKYKTFKMTFQTVDLILGGRPTGDERQTALVRRGGKVIIPPNWLYGWIRDNQALIDTVALQYHIALSAGEFREEPEVVKKTLKVRTGLNTYEAIKPGAIFDVTMRIPLRGSRLTTTEDWQKFFDLLGEAPIRGLGANPRAYGGRVKLIEMEEIA